MNHCPLRTTLWRLPAALRPLLRPLSTAVPHAEPLRILFCGADDFSIRSLLALHAARRDVPGLIDDIHVVHRPAKPTGRGLKTLREVPLAATASSLALPTHPLDTFTSWTPPIPYNLVIAVSFGLLIPPRILTAATHGGLNVHPSLLPDLRGSAPIEHAILRQRTHTGVSVQTLHPLRFDAGVVLAQTEKPGVRIGEGETAGELRGRLAVVGAEMLVRVLRERRYVETGEGRGWYVGPTAYAGKITKMDSCVDFAAMTLRDVLAVRRALGDAWCVLPGGERLVIHDVVELGVDGGAAGAQAGLWWDEGRGALLFRAKCGGVGEVTSSTFPGGKAGRGNAKVERLLRALGRVGGSA